MVPVFAALGDETRWSVLAALGEGDASASALAGRLPVSRQAIAKHLAVLQEVGLVEPVRVGREVQYRVLGSQLRATATRLDAIGAEWDRDSPRSRRSPRTCRAGGSSRRDAADAAPSAPRYVTLLGVTVESRRAAEVPTGAAPRARRRILPPPVWRFAPRRLLHDAVTLTLMLGVLTMLAMAAAAGPLYAEAVSDAAVRLALESVPAGAAAKVAPVVRLNGGIDPESPQWTDMLRSLEGIPGVGPARVTTQSISTELHPKVFFDPVGPVRQRRAGSAPVRLFGVDDPAARLVVVTQAAGGGEGVWLPEPVARVDRASPPATRCRCSCPGSPRRPRPRRACSAPTPCSPTAAPPRHLPANGCGPTSGSRRSPPTPGSRRSAAHLAVADLATTAALAKRPATSCCGRPRPRLTDPTPRLAQFHRTADAVEPPASGCSSRAPSWPTTRWRCAPRS